MPAVPEREAPRPPAVREHRDERLVRRARRGDRRDPDRGPADLSRRRDRVGLRLTTGILGALIPLAVPFLETGAIGAVGLIIALSIASSVVDASPFCTNGALTVPNTLEEQREYVFKRLLQ